MLQEPPKQAQHPLGIAQCLLHAVPIDVKHSLHSAEDEHNLDEEEHPAKYRSADVLCDLEGEVDNDQEGREGDYVTVHGCGGDVCENGSDGIGDGLDWFGEDGEDVAVVERGDVLEW